MLTVSCIFPAPAKTAATAGKLRLRHRRRPRRGRAATAAPDVPSRVTSPTNAPPVALTPQPAMPALSPEIAPPPMKKLRKRRNEVKLLRDCDLSIEIFLSSPPSRGSLPLPPPPFSPQAPSPVLATGLPMPPGTAPSLTPPSSAAPPSSPPARTQHQAGFHLCKTCRMHYHHKMYYHCWFCNFK
jgi:hypothetical protein